MKSTLFFRTALVAVLLLGAITASAHDFEVNGIFYNKNEDGTTVSVTYKGYYADSYDEYSGSVTIPTSVTCSGKTYSVTSIGSGAFYGCRGLTAVKIPNSVTSIGSSAFEGCNGLIRVDITDLEAWCNITFDNSDSNPGHLYLNGSEITNLIIPSTITKIKNYAFSGCSGLTAVEIPNSVTSIGSEAFAYCSGLTAVEIPNSVIYIGEGAFYKCSGLTAVEIPNSVTTIGSSAFSGCSGLTAVEIPNSVIYIGVGAFEGCSGLIRVDITDLEAWCNIDFYYNSNPLCYAHHLYLNGSEVTNLIIPNSVTSIGRLAFYGCSGLTAVEIPNSVTTIGSSAFSGCSGLTAVEIPNSVTEIDNYAFSGCSGLTSVEIPNSVTEIGEYAFSGCSGLTAVEIPNSVTTIGEYAFSGCSGLTAVEIPNSVTKIDYYAFSGCSGLTAVSIGNGVYSIRKDAFAGCDNLEMVVYNAKKCYGETDYVFSSDKGITFVIGAEVKQIEDYILNSSYTSKIVSHAATPPVIASRTFSTTSCPLYVPKDSYAKYWMADVWGKFSDMKQIENTVTNIELNKSAMNIVVNSSVRLTATITPDNATLKEVYWSSDAPTVASVDLYGNVTGLKSGMATITAMAIDGSGVKATCRISVGEIIAENLLLNPSELTLAINQSAKITPVFTPENVSNKTVVWSSSNTNVAVYKTNSDGTITVLGAADGVATITCRTTDGSNLTATCTVTVGTGAVEGIEADAVTVRGENGVIRIEGAEDAKVEVHNASGVCIYSGTATEVPVPQRGIYVVKVAGRATKLSL